MSTQAQLIKAVQSATRKLASSGNFDVLVKDVLSICVDAVGASGGTIYIHEPSIKRLRFEHVLPESVLHLLSGLVFPAASESREPPSKAGKPSGASFPTSRKASGTSSKRRPAYRSGRSWLRR